MWTVGELQSTLRRINGKGYGAYKDTIGMYQFPDYVFSIDHVQSDPHAPPSKVSVRINSDVAGFPKELYRLPVQQVALQDELVRQFGRVVHRRQSQFRYPGPVHIVRCCQEVLERTACHVDPQTGNVLVRFEIAFPARGRTVSAWELQTTLCEHLPEYVSAALYYRNLDAAGLKRIAELAEDQQVLRDTLDARNWCAFVADGSVLPRVSGVSSLPMQDAVVFTSPPELAAEVELPHRGKVRGMAIPRGITLIVGGGYHGKSTLLEALELGVYNHIAGDGRELVITDNTAVKIRAEDGRSVKSTDISMFINNLPNKRDTKCFVTDDASGSTSQAANLIEAMEAGAKLLLIDEDTSATNFMIRDELMQRVISKEMEPITPFISRVRELYERYGISTVLVAGSSGSYFHVADSIIQMDNYKPKLITELAKKEAAAFPNMMSTLEPAPPPNFRRCPRTNAMFYSGRWVKIRAQGRDQISLNDDVIDLRLVEQLVDNGQMTALGYCMDYCQKSLMNGSRTMQQIVDELDAFIESHTIAGISDNQRMIPSMTRPRKQEILACFNRYRNLQL